MVLHTTEAPRCRATGCPRALTWIPQMKPHEPVEPAPAGGIDDRCGQLQEILWVELDEGAIGKRGVKRNHQHDDKGLAVADRKVALAHAVALFKWIGAPALSHTAAASVVNTKE